MWMLMRIWPLRTRKVIFHVAGRVFVKGAFTLTGNPETKAIVRFAIPTDLAKQMKKRLEN
jgi:hypothetical protein